MSSSSGLSPKNISKLVLIPMLAAIVAITPLAIDMYLPALTDIAETFSSEVTVVQQSLSTYLAGYALGMLIFGYLADKFGRRPLVILGLTGFSIVSLLISYSSDINSFFILRFLQALIGAAATVVVPGYIKEVYKENTAKGMSYVSLIMMIAPLIAPAVGTLILGISQWQWIFRFLSIYSALMLFMVIFQLKLPSDKDKNVRTEKSFLGAYSVVFTKEGVKLYIASGVLTSFAFFSYLTASAFVFMEVFGVNRTLFAVIFSLNVGSLMTANIINSRLVTKFGAKRMLYAATVIAIISATGLVSVNILSLSYEFTMIFLMPLMASLGVMSVSCDAIVLMKFKKETGTATAVIGTLRFGCGALAGPVLALLYTGTAVPFSGLMLVTVVGVGVLLYMKSCK
ncbi:Bcr/CflA family efflux MFS transporter [Parashewanella spongiae]|uniref:Bcr/CflA family efflux transporter n=1 Tax=Parashewanella spongiae TaxID=342950 RepID=A0A3A6TXC4_9GAMM|nr:multidrug effflux MFS transporter [Parashewanella spongiae]MCL1077611.1 multidrug effflux MFS transporter [Parashewanella spongiae]RJY13161.1 Bcr/CflA family efflux MFS transporter [Parashewanella spongiae]